MNDRYIKCVLTVIAGALIYLCVVLTPVPAVLAQTPSSRPGVSSGPTEVVVVGWQAGAREPIPVTVQQTQPLRVEGTVATERSTTRLADRVVVVGWETGGTREAQRPMQPITDAARFPVSLPPPR
jgi:hypothetical protein